MNPRQSEKIILTPTERDHRLLIHTGLPPLLKPAIQKFIAQEKVSLKPCLSAIRIGNKLEQLKQLKKLRDLSARPRF